MVVMDVKRLVPATKARHYDVVNPQGEDLGHVQNFMLDPLTNKIAFALVSFGGILGLGDKWIAMPMDILRWDTDNRYFMLDVPREKLEQARGLDKDNWMDEFNLDWLDETYACFNCQPYWDVKTSWLSKESRGGQPLVTGLAQTRGWMIVNEAGDGIGTLLDVVADLQSGCVAYGLAFMSGHDNLPRRTMALPLQCFSLTDNANSLRLNIDAPHLAGGPEFDMKRITEDRGFLKATYMYYGVRLYWENHAIWPRRGAPLHPIEAGSTYKPELYLVSDLLTDPVRDIRGARAGKLVDLMADMETGYLASAVFSLEKMGFGEGLYPLPLEVVSYDVVKREFHLAIDKETIEEAPAFEKGRLPTIDRSGLINIYTAYGFTPYWRERRTEPVQNPVM